jgi:class 3 adenylate cyclase
VTSQAEETARIDLPPGLVTFLFTDIEGSTRLSQTLGESFPQVIDWHHALLRTAIADGGGGVLSTEGDAFLADFTDGPVADLA